MSDFYEFWKIIRFIAVVIGVGALLFCAIQGYSYSLEMEYVGPGGQVDRLNKDYERTQQRESKERVEKGEGTARDYERASQYDLEHSV